jgi:hypothetical protein
MPCICGVDKGFIANVISPTYGDSEVPVRYDRIFTSDDFIDKSNLGTVSPTSGCGKEVETWVEAPLITLKGRNVKAFNPVEEATKGGI